MSEVQSSHVAGQVPQPPAFDVRPPDASRGDERIESERASLKPMKRVVAAVRDAPHWPRVFPGL